MTARLDLVTMANSSSAPVEEGEQYHLDITEFGEEGDGIGYVSGFVVFVPETDIGESVDVEIERIEDSFAVGTVIERYD